MLVHRRKTLSENIIARSISDESITKELTKRYFGKHYYLGLVESVELKSRGFSYITGKKNVYVQVPLELEFCFFTIPKDFIISNAIVSNIKNESNNSTYIFKCSFRSPSGEFIKCQTYNENAPGIIGILNTMNKSADDIRKYKQLSEGSTANLICKLAMRSDGKKYITFNCDLITHAPMKYFAHHAGINIERLQALFLKDKTDNPLFAMHKGTIAKDLTPGTVYAMSIYGFIAANSDNSVDFIKLDASEIVRNSDRFDELFVGQDSIGEYLYAVLQNWLSC